MEFTDQKPIVLDSEFEINTPILSSMKQAHTHPGRETLQNGGVDNNSFRPDVEQTQCMTDNIQSADDAVKVHAKTSAETVDDRNTSTEERNEAEIRQWNRDSNNDTNDRKMFIRQDKKPTLEADGNDTSICHVVKDEGDDDKNNTHASTTRKMDGSEFIYGRITAKNTKQKEEEPELQEQVGDEQNTHASVKQDNGVTGRLQLKSDNMKMKENDTNKNFTSPTKAAQEPIFTIENKDPKTEAQVPRENEELPKKKRSMKSIWTFMKSNAFMLTLLVNAMLEGLMWSVLGQYSYRFFHGQYEDQLSQYNVTKECGVQLKPEVQAIENLISEETARWNLYKQYVTIVPTIVASLLLGMKSDQVGRRFVFLFPFFTSTLACVINAVVIRLELHVGYTLIGDFAYSLSGGNISMAFASHALISDSHGKQHSSQHHLENHDNTNDGKQGNPTHQSTRLASDSSRRSRQENQHTQAITSNTHMNLAIKTTQDTQDAPNTQKLSKKNCDRQLNGSSEDGTKARKDEFENVNENPNSQKSQDKKGPDKAYFQNTKEQEHTRPNSQNIRKTNELHHQTTPRTTTLREAEHNDNGSPKEKPHHHQTSPQEDALQEADDNDLDMSREKARAFKIVVIDILVRLSHSIMAFATGYVIRYAGFFYTLVLVMALKLLAFVYTLTCVHETGEQKKSPGFIAPLRTIARVTKDRWKRVTIILVIAGQLTAMLGYVNEFSILTTYQMSPPFCFDSIQLGYFASEHRAKAVFGIPLMGLWQRLRMSESSIASIAVFFESVSVLMIALIRHTWVFYAAQVVSIPGALSTSMAKAIISRLVGRGALASTFAIILVVEEVNGFVGGLAVNYLYQNTLDALPTACFFMAAAAFMLSSVLFLTQTCRQRYHKLESPADRLSTKL